MKWICVFILMAESAFAFFPTNTTTAHLTTTNVTDYADFNWSWSSMDAQKLDITWDRNIASNTLAFRLARKKTGDTNLEVAGFSISSSNAVIAFSGTNLPPTGTYYAEFMLYPTNSSTSIYRSLSKGKVQIINTLFSATNTSSSSTVVVAPEYPPELDPVALAYIAAHTNEWISGAASGTYTTVTGVGYITNSGSTTNAVVALTPEGTNAMVAATNAQGRVAAVEVQLTAWQTITNAAVQAYIYGTNWWASTARSITSGLTNQWSTAYGWGNHATAGYIANPLTDTLDVNDNVLSNVFSIKFGDGQGVVQRDVDALNIDGAGLKSQSNYQGSGFAVWNLDGLDTRYATNAGAAGGPIYGQSNGVWVAVPVGSGSASTSTLSSVLTAGDTATGQTIRVGTVIATNGTDGSFMQLVPNVSAGSKLRWYGGLAGTLEATFGTWGMNMNGLQVYNVSDPATTGDTSVASWAYIHNQMRSVSNAIVAQIVSGGSATDLWVRSYAEGVSNIAQTASDGATQALELVASSDLAATLNRGHEAPTNSATLHTLRTVAIGATNNYFDIGWDTGGLAPMIRWVSFGGWTNEVDWNDFNGAGIPRVSFLNTRVSGAPGTNGSDFVRLDQAGSNYVAKSSTNAALERIYSRSTNGVLRSGDIEMPDSTKIYSVNSGFTIDFWTGELKSDTVPYLNMFTSRLKGQPWSADYGPTNDVGLVRRMDGDARWITNNKPQSVSGAMINPTLAFTNLVRAAQTNVTPAAGGADLDSATGSGNLAFTNAVRSAQTNVVPFGATSPAITNTYSITVQDPTNMTARCYYTASMPQASTLRKIYCEVNGGTCTGVVHVTYAHQTNAPGNFKVIDPPRNLTASGNSDTSFATSAIPTSYKLGFRLSALSSFLVTNQVQVQWQTTIP